MPDVSVKICGLTAPDHVRAAVDAGARYLGFNFFAKSPRYASPQQAAELATHVPAGVAKVALVVNAPDEVLDDITQNAPFDILQLHGGESIERVQQIKDRYGLPVMKVIGVADEADLAAIDAFSEVADQLLIDAKPPKNAVLPGGNGLAFDWRLLAGRKYWRKPWMLAGGLTPDNVAEAIRMTGARQVDVASGVESAPGVKDTALMKAFIDATR
ncbi:phosphoribosylanthranilate isomerase [Ruegeria sp.]|uniref:phosphoribosylanthranilate isomerase n=1 Tax=Ruegeria sp. TaxID=1879320 RepID=UPI003B00FEBA